MHFCVREDEDMWVHILIYYCMEHTHSEPLVCSMNSIKWKLTCMNTQCSQNTHTNTCMPLFFCWRIIGFVCNLFSWLKPTSSYRGVLIPTSSPCLIINSVYWTERQSRAEGKVRAKWGRVTGSGIHELGPLRGWWHRAHPNRFISYNWFLLAGLTS